MSLNHLTRPIHRHTSSTRLIPALLTVILLLLSSNEAWALKEKPLPANFQKLVNKTGMDGFLKFRNIKLSILDANEYSSSYKAVKINPKKDTKIFKKFLHHLKSATVHITPALGAKLNLKLILSKTVYRQGENPKESGLGGFANEYYMGISIDQKAHTIAHEIGHVFEYRYRALTAEFRSLNKGIKDEHILTAHGMSSVWEDWADFYSLLVSHHRAYHSAAFYFYKSKSKKKQGLLTKMQLRKLDAVLSALTKADPALNFDRWTSNLLVDNRFKKDSPQYKLALSALNGNAKGVKSALKKGGRRNFRTAQGLTALSFAAMGGSQKAVDVVLNKKTKVNQKDLSNIPPLYFAVALRNYDAVKFLLKKKARKDIQADVHIFTGNTGTASTLVKNDKRMKKILGY